MVKFPEHIIPSAVGRRSAGSKAEVRALKVSHGVLINGFSVN